MHLYRRLYNHFFVKKKDDWFICDDDSVSKFNMDKGMSQVYKNAYVLMYLKKDKNYI